MTCSLSLELARKRYDSAQTAFSIAQNEFQAASTAVDHLTEECKRLQAQIAPTALGKRQSTLEGMSASLREVLTKMQNSPVVPSDVV